MAETFKEYMVKQKKSPKDTIAQAGIVLVTVIITFIGLTVQAIPFIGPVIILVTIFAAVAFFNRFNREYEYILTNNELDIDVIYNRSKRKRVITINMKSIEIMASTQDKVKSNELQKGNKIINASDGQNGADTYAIITPHNSALYKILITPNASFLNELHRQAPHKVFKKI